MNVPATFAMLAILATFAPLALARGSAAETIPAAEITIPATDTTPALPAHLARPAKAVAAPAIVVLHGCEGYRTRYGAIADGLAKVGYVAVAIDTLTPRGVKNACSERSGSRIEADDARATLAWLRAQSFVDPTRLALLGYSMGAIATLDIADPFHAEPAPAGLRAAVAYYPACRNRHAANAVVPIQILDGSADTWTPAAPCAALAASAARTGTSIDVTTYPGATHAFDVDLPDRAALGHAMHYDPEATKDALARTLRFFRDRLGALGG